MALRYVLRIICEEKLFIRLRDDLRGVPTSDVIGEWVGVGSESKLKNGVAIGIRSLTELGSEGCIFSSDSAPSLTIRFCILISTRS